MIQTLHINTTGTDYFVGDIHGCYDQLIKKLREVNFDFDDDRLISTGDLTDRGPASEMCLDLLDEPWFYAVCGNHERMAVEVLRGTWPADNFVGNGGAWFMNLSQAKQNKYASIIEKMPYVIEVKTFDGLIGVLHADASKRSWTEYRRPLSDYEKEEVTWGRRRIYNRDKAPVLDVDAVVVGHTVLSKPMVLGNVVYIDTGAVYDKKLTVLSAQQILNLVKGE